MRRCVNRHLADRKGRVLEVGSIAKAPSFKAIFVEIGWEYVGADLTEGNNVDLVLKDPFDWQIADESFDAVISGQMLEHNEMFWLTFLEMGRVMKRGGVMIHIAPSRGPQHRAPQDCWRFYRDGMVALARWSGLELIEATTDWAQEDIEWMKSNRPRQFRRTRVNVRFRDSEWGDTVGVFRKVDAVPATALRYMKGILSRYEPA